ncbi:hypothetical protein [Bradyrhizobium sp. STM 3809]|uniref:hypothetical protein n=1 Tax=Bradyrhizobium sp. STM 3809 TaxID=551936 RepID=UPI0002408281|nr:hypothetical protein [Bradyrhizobium sp. STM 3809]CCE03536.1 exported hypothetical protein [Bradyrhizobium sp. STM 3809]
MLTAIRLMLLALVILLEQNAAIAQDRHDRQSRVRSAVFAEGRLWLLDDGGRLSKMAEGEERVDVTAPEPAIALFVEGGRVAIVTCQPECGWRKRPAERWMVHRRVGDAWETVAEIATKGEQFVAATASMLLTDSRMIDLAHDGAAEMAFTVSATAKPAAPKPLEENKGFRYGGGIMFLQDGRSVDIDDGRPWDTATSLPSPTPAPDRPMPLKGWASAVLVTPKHVFVGYAGGEFGGGLQRIDRVTGEVSEIDEIDGHNVKGLATIPWKPDCTAVAIGLIHFVASGRIVEVCDSSVRTIYEHVIPASTYESPDGRKDCPWFAQTTAFFGLQQRGGDLLAVGNDGLYQIGEGDRAQQMPFPPFKPDGRLGVSFDLSDAVLVALMGPQAPPSQNNGALMLVPR